MSMTTGKIYPGIHIWGAAASTITLLAGGWLMVAPFALGYQPSSADWTRATGNSFWVGLATVRRRRLRVCFLVDRPVIRRA